MQLLKVLKGGQLMRQNFKSVAKEKTTGVGPEGPEEESNTDRSICAARPITSTTLGAAAGGAIVGTVLLGPIFGVVLAGGVVYAT